MHNDAHIQSYLQEQELSSDLIAQVADFRQQYDVGPAVAERVATPTMPFYGRETLEMAIAAILQGENLLLSGEKATGKNVLCETLSWIFGRPSYDISFHVNTGGQRVYRCRANMAYIQTRIIERRYSIISKNQGYHPSAQSVPYFLSQWSCHGMYRLPAHFQ